MSFRGLIRTFQYAKQEQLYIHEITESLGKVSFSANPNQLEVGTVRLPSLNPTSVAISTKNFKSNPQFLKYLHDVFSRKVYGDVAYQMDALNFRSSYLPLGDYKVMLEFMNQRPAFENTVGFVHVDDSGVMVDGSYQPNDIYELVNSDGIVKLTDYMAEEIKKELN